MRGLVNGADGHLFAAAAAGQQTDADFDQSGVEFGVRLTGVRVQRDFSAAAEGHAEGRDHDGLVRELDGLRHVLELADGHVNFVPLLLPAPPSTAS